MATIISRCVWKTSRHGKNIWSRRARSSARCSSDRTVRGRFSCATRTGISSSCSPFDRQGPRGRPPLADDHQVLKTENSNAPGIESRRIFLLTMHHAAAAVEAATKTAAAMIASANTGITTTAVIAAAATVITAAPIITAVITAVKTAPQKKSRRHILRQTRMKVIRTDNTPHNTDNNNSGNNMDKRCCCSKSGCWASHKRSRRERFGRKPAPVLAYRRLEVVAGRRAEAARGMNYPASLRLARTLTRAWVEST